MEHKIKVIEYFKGKADEYDLVDGQHYWKLSDKLLWHAFKTKVLDKLPPSFTFLDAGGGTGRWTYKILKNYPEANGILVDLSPDMLSVANKKINESNKGRIELVEADLHNLKQLNSERFDVIFNFHNVLGFVESPQKVMSNLKRLLKLEGKIVSLLPNKYHAMFFNIYVGNFQNIQELEITGKGRFTDSMPSIHFFTPSSIETLYKNSGLNVDLITGFPSLIYPGLQETKISGSSEKVIGILEEENNFNQIFEIEKRFLDNREIASRGNNLFIIGGINEAI